MKNSAHLDITKKKSKECHSTVNEPLFNEEDDVCVIEKCVIPELHILQGFVNHLFWNGLVPLLGRERALVWPKKLNLISKNYHGDIFEGNACRRLLKESDRLFDLDVLGNVMPIQIQPFVSVFKSMNKVVESCFSTKKYGSVSDLAKNIDELKKTFKAIDVSETLKIHVALHHLQHCLHFLGNDGLGLWSEQAGESIHREFLKYWGRYKINNIEDKNYKAQLKKAVIEFSSTHI